MAITNVQSLSELASTTLASYAALNIDRLASSLSDPGTGADFTSTQAAAFAEKYKFLSQRPNVDVIGFSAAVFEDKTTHEKVFAIRGTEFTKASRKNNMIKFSYALARRCSSTRHGSRPA